MITAIVLLTILAISEYVIEGWIGAIKTIGGIFAAVIVMFILFYFIEKLPD